MHAPLAPLQVEWRPLGALRDIEPEWRQLAARALSPNVFYEPAFALAAEPVFGDDVVVGLVWSQLQPRHLLGLFPMHPMKRRYGIPLPLIVGWAHPFAPLATPLVDRDLAEPVIAAWLTSLRDDHAFPSTLLLPYVPEDGAFARAFDRALARHGMAERRFGAHRRALLAPPDDRARYIEQVVSGRKRKELRRQSRRMDETGAVSVGSARDPAAVAAALQDFLTLEAQGWKGRKGTAARDDTAIRTFMQSAVAGLAAEGKVSVHHIRSGDTPAAIGIVLRSGSGAWFWKIAYDETRARFSPGVLLTLELTDALVTDPAVDYTDSCATPDHAMIDHLWRERLALSDRFVLTRPEERPKFVLICKLERLRRMVVAAVKGLRNRMRS